MKTLGKFSIGLGDRFGHEGDAQLKAIIDAAEKGVEITPVWNKSNREHLIIGTRPEDVRTEAESVTKNAEFKLQYFVDADHINFDTVDRFIESSDFFTIDVASYIGKKADEEQIRKFLGSAEKYFHGVNVPGIENKLLCSKPEIISFAEKYLLASKQAGKIYKKICWNKGSDNFITEISMDEVPNPQTPVELFFVLNMLAGEKIPVQTIAPKFAGRFNKGVDYVGDPQIFALEFEQDLLIISYAINEFKLPANLKLSIHSGSDKFSIYPGIKSLLKKYDKGVHLKTAGTTWLEELIGLAKAGGESLRFVKNIYLRSLQRIEELCAPYSDVIEINIDSLPSPDEVSLWDKTKFASALIHDKGNPDYNPHMRQLLHVAYKLAADETDEFFRLLEENKDAIFDCVYGNIFNKHLCKLFEIN